MNGTVVVIDSFIPTRPTEIHSGGGLVRLDFSVLGVRQFIVMLIEPHGEWPVVWNGTSYQKAVIEARDLAADYGCEVVDKVAEGRGG